MIALLYQNSSNTNLDLTFSSVFIWIHIVKFLSIEVRKWCMDTKPKSILAWLPHKDQSYPAKVYLLGKEMTNKNQFTLEQKPFTRLDFLMNCLCKPGFSTKFSPSYDVVPSHFLCYPATGPPPWPECSRLSIKIKQMTHLWTCSGIADPEWIGSSHLENISATCVLHVLHEFWCRCIPSHKQFRESIS
jgi:hypothetical protein